MSRRALVVPFLAQAALAALLLAPGLAGARSAATSTDEARRQAAATFEPATPTAASPAGPIASTDQARATAEARPPASHARHAARPAAPIQSTDDARALAAARTDEALVAIAIHPAR